MVGTMMKEIGRVVNGLRLVAKEAVKPQQTTTLQSLIKRALLSATDLSGLTKGQLIRHFPNSDQSSSRKNGGSVVFFKDKNIIIKEEAAEEEEVSKQFSSDTSSHLGGGVSDTTVTAEDDVVVFSSPASPSPTSMTEEDIAISSNIVSPMTEEDIAAQPPPPPPPLVKKNQRKPRERRVPSTPFSRALGFAGLGAGLAWGTLQESAKRLVFGTPQDKQSAISPFLSEKNAERLALALCRMRGAALKLGQMLSIQDESLVPAPILAALDIVRQGADVMPKGQLNQVLERELGPEWSSMLTSFDYEPVAAASIGQVHRAVTKDGLVVAMKIQYPGVANSIESDIENVKLLLDYTNLIPENLYLDRAMKVAKEELSRECDYELEAENQTTFRNLLSNTEGFYVPLVVDEISSKRILSTELVPGIPVDKVALLDQETRNYVGKKLLELTLKELFVFRFMQTDPNWSNFLYDEATRSINLIDFGAARNYPKRFVDDYLKMVVACANCEREAVIEMSQRLGFLTGMESDVMLEAHVQAAFVVGLPFSKPEGYDFRSSNITQSISNIGATMLRHRLTPPPDEVYSLHRKLAGAFLACIKIGAVVQCRELLLQVYENHQFGDDNGSAS